jgi:hypothetical protein
MLLWGPQTPINTEQNRNSNRFRKRTIHNRQKRRRDQANFNEFLGAVAALKGLSTKIGNTYSDAGNSLTNAVA